MHKKPAQYFIYIPLAYLYTAFEKLFSLPAYMYVGAFFIACVLATLATLTPQSAAKIQLASSSQSLEDYARFLQLSQASGNDELNQHIYQNLLPVIQSQPFEIKEKLREVVFPQERVETLLKFWEGLYEKQPNSRETNAALAILSYQKFENEKFQQYLKRWQELEPNDSRVEDFTQK